MLVDISGGSSYRPTAVVASFREAKSALLKPPNNLGLVGYWSFNEGTGTTATDFSGNGNHGTLSTSGGEVPTWTNGKRGKALSFDAVDDFVNAGSGASLDVTGTFTIALWAKKNSLSGTDGFTVRSDAEGTYSFGTSNDQLFLFLISNTELSTNANMVTNRWYHVVVTYNASTNSIIFYVDGVPISDDGGASAINLVSNQVRHSSLGKWMVAKKWMAFLMRSASTAAFSDRPKSPRSTKSGAVKFTTSSVNLQQGSTLANGLVGHWTFDGPDITTTVTDRSGQNNHGYFVGGATSSAKVIGKLGQALNFDNNNDRVCGDPNESNFDFERTSVIWSLAVEIPRGKRQTKTT